MSALRSADVRVTLSATTLALLTAEPPCSARRRRRARVVWPTRAEHPVLVLSRALASWGRR